MDSLNFANLTLQSAVNQTSLQNIVKMDSNFAWLMASLLSAIIWVVYITYYNARLIGYILTRIINRLFIKEGYFKIGSITLNVISGKIMFRDVVYITYDYSVRIQDGYLIFRWWRSYVPKDVSEDLSHSDTRLSVMLNGFELHVYNRSQLYGQIERAFELDPKLFFPGKNNDEAPKEVKKEKKPRAEAVMARTWRDLIPVIKMDVSSGRVVFGNRLLPTTLSITAEESHFVYSTKPAATTMDRMMHFSKVCSENVKVMLAPSISYTGMRDEPPRYMGEGFVLMSTNYLEMYMYIDEPGIVPEQAVLITLANGDIVESSPPMGGLDIKCGKGTDFSYGPWADRQRDHLFKFFYPTDFKAMEVTKSPKPGDKRQMQAFDIRLSLLNEATIDLLFSKNKETNATHINVGAGSYMEITLPWITLQDGYRTKINGQFLHLDATTSLQYRDLISSETLEFNIECKYPRIWNHHQEFVINLTGCKTTAHLLYAHKNFFQDLVVDWSNKNRPDLVKFVPYTWRFGLTLKHCELMTPTNQHNWADCSSLGQKQRLENTQLALCAHLFHLSFDLPFGEFLPTTVPVTFCIQGESIDLSIFLPEVCTGRSIALALDQHAKILAKDGGLRRRTENIPKWRNICQKSMGWVDFWWVPIGAISIQYIYHPAPPLGPQPQADISTPVKEELLLSPIRFPHTRKPAHCSPAAASKEGANKFDPQTLPADRVVVELEMGPSVLMLHGSALRNFLHFKDNVFGDDQLFTDMQSSTKPELSSDVKEVSGEDFDYRNYRPLEVDVSIIMHDVQGHLLKNCTESDSPCPVILLERFGFEIKKRYNQTELQLLLSPAVLLISDYVPRPNRDKQLNQGRLTLSSFLLRGHAMFSDQDRSLDQETIEYAWLLEIQLGKLSGKITSPQLHQLVTSLETLILTMGNSENDLVAPSSCYVVPSPAEDAKATPKPSSTALQTFLQKQQTGAGKGREKAGPKAGLRPQPQEVRREDCFRDGEAAAIASFRLKYKIVRAAVDAVDLWLVESGVAMQFWVSPVRLASCNLHGKNVSSGLSCVIYSTLLKQLVWQPTKYNHGNRGSIEASDLWLEVGSVNLGPLTIESASATTESEFPQLQQRFLKLHDGKTKRLWFLWPEINKGAGKCGCVGGCVFFGSNSNGNRFFKPNHKDVIDGFNVAAFRINEPGKDPGYGQSILHENQLIFRTPPYNTDVILHETGAVKAHKEPTAVSCEKRTSRRFSYTALKKDIPYSRLVDAASVLPLKLDSDSKLHTERKKLSLSVPEAESAPKNSVSDSKLAVDYFNAPVGNVSQKLASDSHHSLSSQNEVEKSKEVQRTISMTSENQSDTFFSADEEVNQSRSSSLKYSMLDQQEIDTTRKKFASDLSIVANRSAGSVLLGQTALQDTVKNRLSSHRSDHEINTPEHRSFAARSLHMNNETVDLRTVHGLVTPNRRKSVNRPIASAEERAKNLKNVLEIQDQASSSSTGSLSSSPYVSAVGSQEDLALVDLHMQGNMQIIDSPMLMSSYVSHLSQARCGNWSQSALPSDCDAFAVPMFQKTNDSKLVYVGGQFVPVYDPISEGFTSLKMLSRTEGVYSPKYSGGKTPTYPYTYTWDSAGASGEAASSEDGGNLEEELLSSQPPDSGSRTAVIIKLKGDLDIMVCPLLLESFQRFVDALTPTMASIHPLAVVNHLHASCLGQVEAANMLKTEEKLKNWCRKQSSNGGAASGDLKETGAYEELIKTQLQAALILPRVNITLLQASVVEEIISFSALDNIKDLTCVSLFAVCFDNITARLHTSKQTKEVIQTFYRPAVVQSGSKKGNKGYKMFLLGHHSASVADTISGQPVYVETSETQQAETVLSLAIGKAHSQLRRLPNESSILNDAIITAIPTHCSKVLFTCSKIYSPVRGMDYYLYPPPEQPTETCFKGEEMGSEEKLGFIMFECGLEGISIKVVKRSQFEKMEDFNDDRMAGKTTDSCYTDSVRSRDDLEAKSSEEAEKKDGEVTKDGGNVSSCAIEVKLVWFNFAAPPRSPFTRRIDYTRLDWNLLSTASPSINAWMNPSNRLAIRVVHMFRTMYRRSTGVAACLMTLALETQGIHILSKSRYNNLTQLATTLREDPSCQLCTILQKYVLQSDMSTIEANLREMDLPQLSILRQGVIVLSRQWKNILYTPLLLDQNHKSRLIRPLNVTFAVPELEEEVYLTDGETSGNDEADVTDECAMLLRADAMIKQQKGKSVEFSVPLNSPLPPPSQVAVVQGGFGSVLTSPSPPLAKRKQSLRHPHSSPASGRGYEFMPHHHQVDSDPSVYTHSSPDLPSSPLHRPTAGQQQQHQQQHRQSCEDLYSWMAKQQESVKQKNDAEEVLKLKDLSGRLESKINTLATESSGEVPHAGVNVYPMQDSLRLLDAHIIFQPLLTSLGVMPHQMVSAISENNNLSSLDSLGSNLSLIGTMDTLKIDIVVSEYGKKNEGKRTTKTKPKPVNKLHLDINPAFICEKVSVELELNKMADMTVDDMIRTRNVLYISRGQLKKHTSTSINFSIAIRYISQQVNMPLLRLLHQISNMYQNVKERQNELREQGPEMKRARASSSDQAVALKHHSSSASDLQETVSVEPEKRLKLKISDPGSQKTIMSPSPSVRSKPQSFAQKLRSTGKSVRGYMNLGDGANTPALTNSPSGSAVGSEKSASVHCWKTVYHLLDLYATMPETKTITHRFSMAGDVSEHYKGTTRKYDLLVEMRSSEDVDKAAASNGKELSVSVAGERTRLVVFGVARIHRTRLLATLSGLKLEAEITSLHSSLTYRKKSRPASLELSLTGQVGRTMIVLLEGVAPNQQTVVKVTVGKSQTLYSSVSRKGKDKNSGLLTIGAVNVDIPQHPVALHGMVTRGSKQLSSTLQELRVTRTSSRMSKDPVRFEEENQYSPSAQKSTTAGFIRQHTSFQRDSITETGILQPLVMQFSVILQSLSITAALLPSLQAQYKMDQLSSTGITGNKAKFTVDLPQHSLSFTTKLQTSEANLPPEASIGLPAVHVSAEYVPEGAGSGALRSDWHGLALRKGGYLSAQADIGAFEHSLTTDLLNHLVFVQKVFMKEVNEVVQKVYGGERPVPLWLEENETETPSILSRILFSLVIRLQRIQLTATTAGSSAVRLETGTVALELSNRVQKVVPSTTRLFGKARVDINLSLGQLIRNPLFEEVEPEFQQFAFFKTRVELRNALQDEMVDGEDKEVVLITLKRPLIYIKPVAVDKAILVWLNYKNAYDYWNEKRANLNKEVLTATQQILEKVPFGQLTSQLSTSHIGKLFLELTVDDMGICLPLNPVKGRCASDDTHGAVVVTLESTSIAACSSDSLVSKARFSNLCLRFADDFETSFDDWKPDMADSSIMNLCVVTEGTYEVCSRTIAAKQPNENAKWFLNVQWQMEGVDIHLDVNVGKQLSALGHTLTMLTGAEDNQNRADYDYSLDDLECVERLQREETATSSSSRSKWAENLPAFVFDPSLDQKKRSKLIEREMNEQAKIIRDLQVLGASHGTIQHEMRRYRELEEMVYKGFRRDMMQKLRRQSTKAAGPSSRSGARPPALEQRSKSFMAPSPTPEHHNEMESPDTAQGGVGSPESASYESSPKSGPSRSTSLRVKNVTFSDSQSQFCRQSSLPSTSSELNADEKPEENEDWVSHLDIDGEQVELRRKVHKQSNFEDSSPPLDRTSKEHSSRSSYGGKQPEPNIDFELDVKVLINSGKCVLHTKDAPKEEELKQNRMRKDRSCSTGLLDFPANNSSSPDSSRRNKEAGTKLLTTNLSSGRLRPNLPQSAQLMDLTIFHIPGMDVKVHYESKVDEKGAQRGPTAKKAANFKKASLFAWMTLQSVAEETVISPHILDFLEQTLEPIPSKSSTGDSSLTAYGNYVYASFPVDVIVYFHMQPSTFRFSCLPISRVECMLQLPSLDIVFSSKRTENETESDLNESSKTAVGGLSVTGCLADFSVYIFHPYGGGKKSALKEVQSSPLSDSERKDSLAINVEFVKFHLSRSRKLNIHDPTKGKLQDQSKATIRFSTIVDIGSASFKYDMRKLTEILAFPKAWYRRTIVRRLFLGDLSVSAGYSEDGDEPKLPENEQKSPLLRDKLRLSLDADVSRISRLKDFSRAISIDSAGTPSVSEMKSTTWETLVLFAVNFAKLNVHMNMGNVMGNVTWQTKDFRSDGRLNIGSAGNKTMYIALGLGGSALDAKGGIVGGNIEIANIDTYVLIREEPNAEPDHTIGLKLFALELRLDYMATSVLMFRVSRLDATLRDEWRLDRRPAPSAPDYAPTRRPATIFVHGDLGWHQLQTMISKSSTADLLKMYLKLDEFFSQQFNSSKRVFSRLQPGRGREGGGRGKGRGGAEPQPASGGGGHQRHHRHWQEVLGQVAGLQVPLPPTGTILGGTMELHGQNISLACFHGINFKSKSWALFSLKEPCISFNTEAQEIPSAGSAGLDDVHVVQTLTCSLGLSTYKTDHSMATVCKVSRNVMFPPQFKTLQEWFVYAFACSQIDEVEKFPYHGDPSSQKPGDPNHTREVIFALPSLQLHLTTEHLQAAERDSGPASVMCSFITEFEDHIFVTVDAEAFFFLHDLITSYVKEKERVFGQPRPTAAGGPGNEEEKRRFDPSEVFTRDGREYECKTWHLEPTVRLLSWAGKSIEPYGIDYILQKLGFSHARTTIPKWMQRGFMDPLDKVLALLAQRMMLQQQQHH